MENELVAKNSAKKTILIVEDEELLSDMYQDVFKREGFHVATAGTGQEALRLARTEKPDFILLDILMPEDNGIYFLEQRKKKPEIEAIPVVAFSNFDDPHIKKQAFDLGIEDYLIKTDYTPQEILDKAKKYIL